MVILAYYVFMTVTLFLFMGIDKKRAIEKKWRISERTLLILSLIGGGIGGYTSMLLFRHKIRKFYFHLLFALSSLFHIALLLILQPIAFGS